MKHNAEEMGKQFLLSDREIEVMALYALGYTQKRVAEELFITQARRMPTSSESTLKPACTPVRRSSTILNSTRRRIGCRRSPRIRHASADEETKEDPGGTGCRISST